MANEKMEMTMANEEEITVELTTDKFVQFMQGAFYDDRIKTSHTLTVYTALCLYRYGKTNQAKIAMSTLIKIARTSAKSARADIKLLKELGYIKDIKSGKKAAELNDTNTYIMHDKPVPFTPIEGSIIGNAAREYLEVNDTILKEAAVEGKDVQIYIPKKGDIEVKLSPARKPSEKTSNDAEVVSVEETPVKTSNEDTPVESTSEDTTEKTSNVDTTSNAEKTSNVGNAPVKPARKVKFKVAKKALDSELKTSNVGKIKRV